MQTLGNLTVYVGSCCNSPVCELFDVGVQKEVRLAIIVVLPSLPDLKRQPSYCAAAAYVYSLRLAIWRSLRTCTWLTPDLGSDFDHITLVVMNL